MENRDSNSYDMKSHIENNFIFKNGFDQVNKITIDWSCFIRFRFLFSNHRKRFFLRKGITVGICPRLFQKYNFFGTFTRTGVIIQKNVCFFKKGFQTLPPPLIADMFHKQVFFTLSLASDIPLACPVPLKWFDH